MRVDDRLAYLRTSLLLGTAFLAGVAIVPVSSLIARHLGVNAAFAQDSDRADTYRLLALFGEVFERVRLDYVDPVSDRDLIENAINGMLTGLDPHSNYVNADGYREVQLETEGKFGGLGIEITEDDGLIKVTNTMDNTPASKVRIKAGDIIIALNGKPVQGLSLEEAIKQLRGAAHALRQTAASVPDHRWPAG